MSTFWIRAWLREFVPAKSRIDFATENSKLKVRESDEKCTFQETARFMDFRALVQRTIGRPSKIICIPISARLKLQVM